MPLNALFSRKCASASTFCASGSFSLTAQKPAACRWARHMSATNIPNKLTPTLTTTHKTEETNGRSKARGVAPPTGWSDTMSVGLLGSKLVGGAFTPVSSGLHLWHSLCTPSNRGRTSPRCKIEERAPTRMSGAGNRQEGGASAKRGTTLLAQQWR
eukprot:6709695-Prymnesium_polylepis.2